MYIPIYPQEKVVFGDISICFGMEQSAVELALGAGEAIGDRCYYFNTELAIDYREGKVDFIEFLGGIEGRLKPVVYGVSAFDADAEELVQVLKTHNSGEICDNEGGYSCQFFHISIGLYRETLPDEIRDLVEEAKEQGSPMSDAEIQQEMRRASHWLTLGCGSAGYYRR